MIPQKKEEYLTLYDMVAEPVTKDPIEGFVRDKGAAYDSEGIQDILKTPSGRDIVHVLLHARIPTIVRGRGSDETAQSYAVIPYVADSVVKHNLDMLIDCGLLQHFVSNGKDYYAFSGEIGEMDGHIAYKEHSKARAYVATLVAGTKPNYRIHLDNIVQLRGPLAKDDAHNVTQSYLLDSGL
jgi:hypothetical protein